MTGEKYGLIGKTLVHSYSKEIHEALGRYQYQLFSLSEEMPTLSSTRFSLRLVTIPYKQDVIPLCDEVTDLARAGSGSDILRGWCERSRQGRGFGEYPPGGQNPGGSQHGLRRIPVRGIAGRNRLRK